MIYYIDTSALVKLYAYEKGTEAMKALFESNATFCSSIVIYPEVLLSLQKKLRNGEISNNDLLTQSNSFENHYFAKLNIIELKENIFDIFKRKVLGYATKALDAIHLASALWVKDSFDSPCTFVCSDKKLLNQAIQEGFEYINPEKY